MTSIRERPVPGTASDMEDDASTTVVIRALCTVIVQVPRASWSAAAEAGSPAGSAYGCGTSPPAFATSVFDTWSSEVRKPRSVSSCSCSGLRRYVMNRIAARLSSVVSRVSSTSA